jgi:hypothetical protein
MESKAKRKDADYDETNTITSFFSQFNFSTHRIGRSVMKRLRLPQPADIDVRLRTPAVLPQEDREHLVTNHALQISRKKSKQHRRRRNVTTKVQDPDLHSTDDGSPKPDCYLIKELKPM